VTGSALGAVIAAAAAVLFAVGAVLQQEVAAGTASAGQPNLRRLLTSRAWLAGQGATVVAVALQVVALGLAPVSVVQPLLAGGLVVALGIRSVRDRRVPSGTELLGAAMTAGGLAVFLVAARPAAVARDHVPGALAALAAVLLAVALVALAGRLPEGPWGAAATGLAAGVAMGIAAVLVSAALTALRTGDLLHALTGSAVWGAVVVALAAGLGTQQAFARGSLSWSLPALTVADPLAAVPAARILLGERLEPGHAGVWVPAGIVAALGVVLLARSGEGRRRPAVSAENDPRSAEPDRCGDADGCAAAGR
jgi:drug/metabolite transporter (DMT)-like permease